MPDWLTTAFKSDETLTVGLMAARLGAALGFGCIVAGVYRLTRGHQTQPVAGFVGTLVLLTILIAAMTLVIGDSIARAFSVVGALAIVRFRTVVEDTRDTAFVIFAVCVGMALGAGHMLVPLIVIPVAGVGAWLFRPSETGAEVRLLIRTGPGFAGEEALHALLGRHVEAARLLAMSTARQGSAFERSYAARLKSGASVEALIGELHGHSGVQQAELTRG